MKILFFLLVAANIVIDIASYFVLPETVATHFVGNGIPNGWFSANGSLAFNLGLHGFFLFVIYSMSVALQKTPKALINIPNKEYWIAERNFPLFLMRWEFAVFQLGCALMIFFMSISFVILDANFSNPVHMNTTASLAALIGFMLFMFYWLASLIRNFRLPE